MKNSIKLILFGLMLIFSVNLVYSENKAILYGVSVQFEDNEFQLKTVFLDYGFYEKGPEEGDFSLRIIDSSGKILKDEKFNIGFSELTALPSWFDESGKQIYVPDAPNPFYKTFFVPFSPKASSIEIFDNVNNRAIVKKQIKSYVDFEAYTKDSEGNIIESDFSGFLLQSEPLEGQDRWYFALFAIIAIIIGGLIVSIIRHNIKKN